MSDRCELLTIIVTFNGIKWIERCLYSVTHASVNSDIYIIDNGSSDGTIDFIKENYPEIQLCLSHKNVGFGAANNRGIDYAIKNNYKFVYLLNQDAWIDSNTFEKLIGVAQANPNYGVLSPLQVNGSGKLVDQNFYRCCSRKLLSDALLDEKIKSVYKTDFVMAAHWLITRECLKIVGNFSSTFPHYGEDNNYVDRIRYHNLEVGIVPNCIGVHDREERSVTESKNEYLFYVEELVKLSNPNVQYSFFKTLVRFGMEALKRKRIGYLKYAYKIIIDARKITVNRIKSQSIGAFY